MSSPKEPSNVTLPPMAEVGVPGLHRAALEAARRSHAACNEERELEAMIHAKLVAECVAVESYSQLVALVGDNDPTTRRLLEDILADEQKHADELQGWHVQ